jgi:hypothetical protein
MLRKTVLEVWILPDSAISIPTTILQRISSAVPIPNKMAHKPFQKEVADSLLIELCSEPILLSVLI